MRKISLSKISIKSLPKISIKSLPKLSIKSLPKISIKLPSKLSSSFSKFINVFTAFVYIFTTVGSSLSHATNIITVGDSLEENVSHGQTHQRYDLSLKHRPECDGIFFDFTNHDFPENSLQSFVSLKKLSSLPHFSPRLNSQKFNIGFKTTLPDFGTIYCDWSGNLSLVGLATQSNSPPPLSLSLTTNGYVSLAGMAFQDLSLHGSGASFRRDITIEGDSVFHVKTLNLMSSGFENKHAMRFLSKTRFLSEKQWSNSGTIFSEQDLVFNDGSLENKGIIHSENHLDLSLCKFYNIRGRLIGDTSVSLTINHVYDSQTGDVSSNGLVKFIFKRSGLMDIGHVSGKNVILEDLSGSRFFQLKDSVIKATQDVTLIGNSPTMRGVSFITPTLILDADSFTLGDQGNVGRTIVMLRKNQRFSLTKPYKTNGSLEFWQDGL